MEYLFGGYGVSMSRRFLGGTEVVGPRGGELKVGWDLSLIQSVADGGSYCCCFDWKKTAAVVKLLCCLTVSLKQEGRCR